MPAEHCADGAIRAEGTNRLERSGRVSIDRQDRTPQIGNLNNGVHDEIAAVYRAIAVGEEPHILQHDFKLIDLGRRKPRQIFQCRIANAGFDKHASLAAIERELVEWPEESCCAAWNLAGHERILKPGVKFRLED